MTESHFIECHGKRLAVTPYGFLINAGDWSEELARQLAPQENIDQLNGEHWQVIHFLREYYDRFNIAPMGKKIAKSTGIDLDRLKELFPKGPGKSACRLAGLPKPVGCL